MVLFPVSMSDTNVQLTRILGSTHSAEEQSDASADPVTESARPGNADLVLFLIETDASVCQCYIYALQVGRPCKLDDSRLIVWTARKLAGKIQPEGGAIRKELPQLDGLSLAWMTVVYVELTMFWSLVNRKRPFS